MATITSAGSGLWSAGATWVGGVAPADNDAVVIASGHVVVFDVDQSGFANGIDGITITGTLSLTRTTGTYYLKIKAAKTIGGAGTFDCGTSGSIIPFAAKHTITGGAGWYIQGSGGLTMTVYAAEPVIKTILLSGDEAIGQTILSVDTSVIGDLWADGDTIRINDINRARESEVRLIAAGGIAAGEVTITAGLTAAKSTGAVICLVTRNVRFIAVGASGYVAQNFASGKLIIAGGEWTSENYRILNACTGVVISAGVFHSNAAVTNGCASLVINGGVFTGNNTAVGSSNFLVTGGTFVGNSYVAFVSSGFTVSGGTYKGHSHLFYLCTGFVVSGGTFYGSESFCFQGASIIVTGGTITGCTYGFANTTAEIKNAILGSNTYDVYNSKFTAFNVLFGSTAENGAYTSMAKEIYSESIDHDQVAGAYRAWTKGGVTSSQASVLPTGYTTAMQTVLENAAVEGYWQKEYTVGAGASIQFTMNLRKAASMTYLPRCIIFNKASADPFAGGAGLHTFTMTDSVDTWEAESWTYTNSTAADVTLVVRFQGMHATATFYSALLAEQINVDLTTALAQIAAVKAKTDNLPADPADESALEAAIAALPDAAAVATAVQSSVVEGTITTAQALRLMLAVLAGKASGGGTTTVTFRDTADSKDRVTATVDSNGNRSAVVLDGA